MREGKPFYFMINSRDPHRPYCKPNDLGHRDAEAPSRFYKPSEVTVPGFLPDIPEVREEMAAYLNSTRRLDDTFGKVMKAMTKWAPKRPELMARVDLFRHRVPEELYDLQTDPDGMTNLVDKPEYKGKLQRLKAGLKEYMKISTDPMLPAFNNPTDRAAIDKLILNTYGRIAGAQGEGKGKKKGKGRNRKGRK